MSYPACALLAAVPLSLPGVGGVLGSAAACLPDRVVRILVAPGCSIPFTAGVIRPAVILPDRPWRETPGGLAPILMHELVHVRRWDFLSQRLAHLACCLFWFVPLPWLALRRLREEQERACDEAVLAWGVAPKDYPRALVENPYLPGTSYQHRGIDIAWHPGSSVLAAAKGTVVTGVTDPAYGFCVVLDHGGGYQTLYAHLEEPALVGEGEVVRRGQRIGLVGNTGHSVGYHLHFEVLKDGEPIDPVPLL